MSTPTPIMERNNVKLFLAEPDQKVAGFSNAASVRAIGIRIRDNNRLIGPFFVVAVRETASVYLMKSGAAYSEAELDLLIAAVAQHWLAGGESLGLLRPHPAFKPTQEGKAP